MIFKLAQHNPQFERSFADLAYAVLKDKAPKLLDYLIGFQVVDKDEDETKAVGIFGFKVGKQWFYAPMFFMNGELKGSELLYIKDQDSFVPLQENWVNYLINRKPMVLGEGTPYTEKDIYATAPDFSIFSRSPIRNSCDKISQAKPCVPQDGEKPWHGTLIPIVHDGDKRAEYFDLRPAMRCFTVSPNGPTFKLAAERMDLGRVIKDLGIPASRYLLGMMQEHPKMAGVLAKHYNAADLVSHGPKPTPLCVQAPTDERLRKAGVSRREFNWWVKRAASTGRIPPPNVFQMLKEAGARTASDVAALLPQLMLPPREAPREKSGTARVWVLTKDSDLDALDVTDGERTEIMIDGYAVRDARKDTEKSAVYHGDKLRPSTLPMDDHGALYQMLTKDGEVRPTIVRGRFIIDKESGTWDSRRGRQPRLPLVSQSDADGWRAYCDSLQSTDTMEKGSAYILVDPDGVISEPIKILERDGDLLKIASCVNFDRTDAVLSDKVRGFRGVNSRIATLPKAKVIKVSAREGLAHEPASSADVSVFLMEKVGMEPLTIWSNGSRYQLEHEEKLSDEMTKIATICHLIRGIGVTKEAARLMMDEARKEGSKTFFVKRAQDIYGGPLIPGPDSPPTNIFDTMEQYDSRLNVPVGYHESEMVPVEPYGMYGNEELYNPLTADPETARAAIGAAEKGQKEVLDTSVLAGLVKAMDTDPVIDKYLGDLVVGEDRLGRLLFMFYWHNDKFQERYGEAEMSELEDSLRNSFKGVGDLILFLKKKTVEPEVSLMGSDVDLKPTPV
jgi:hypothetical protein